jgi:predicted transcriptional regulator
MSDSLETASGQQVLKFVTQIISAYLATHSISAEAVPGLIREVFQSLRALTPTPEAPHAPAVPPRRSVFDDYLICLEDGLQMKMLKRHLLTVHRMTPTEYRARWGLAPDYPMVAPAYAKVRSTLAKQSGLGKKPEDRPQRAAAEARPKRRRRAE